MFMINIRRATLEKQQRLDVYTISFFMLIFVCFLHLVYVLCMCIKVRNKGYLSIYTETDASGKSYVPPETHGTISRISYYGV